MKKLTTILFLGLLTLSGCSSDDDNSPDPLIGEWKEFSIIVIESNGEESETIHTEADCAFDNRFLFKNDSSVNTWLYTADNDTQECVLLEDFLTDFTWSRTSTNNYKYNYTTGGNDPNEVNVNVEFQDNGAVKIERFNSSNIKTKYIRL